MTRAPSVSGEPKNLAVDARFGFLIPSISTSITYLEDSLESMGCFRSPEEFKLAIHPKGRLMALAAMAVRDPVVAQHLVALGHADVAALQSRLEELCESSASSKSSGYSQPFFETEEGCCVTRTTFPQR